MNSAFASAASCRDRLSNFPHKTGLRRNDVSLSNIARSLGTRSSARRLGLKSSQLCRTPRRLQQFGQTISPRCSRKVLAHRPQVGQTNNDQLPPLGNLRSVTPTNRSTSPSRTRNCVVSTVMIPSARRREIETLGKSSRTILKVAFTANWINHSPSFEKSTSS